MVNKAFIALENDYVRIGLDRKAIPVHCAPVGQCLTASCYKKTGL